MIVSIIDIAKGRHSVALFTINNVKMSVIIAMPGENILSVCHL
jgi:hypothetical protein